MVSFADGQALERALNPPTTLDKDAKVDVEEHIPSSTPHHTTQDESITLSKGEKTVMNVDVHHSYNDAPEPSSDVDDVEDTTSGTDSVDVPEATDSRPVSPIALEEVSETTSNTSDVEIPTPAEKTETEALPQTTELNKEEPHVTEAMGVTPVREAAGDTFHTSEPSPAPLAQDESGSPIVEPELTVSETVSGEPKASESDPSESQNAATNDEELPINTTPAEHTSEVDELTATQPDTKEAPVVMPVSDEVQPAPEEQTELSHESLVTGHSTGPSNSITSEDELNAPHIPESVSVESNATLVDPITEDTAQPNTQKPNELPPSKESIDVDVEPAVLYEHSSVEDVEPLTSQQFEVAAGNTPDDGQIEAAEQTPNAPVEYKEQVAEPIPSVNQSESLAVSDDLGHSELATPEQSADSGPTAPAIADRSSDEVTSSGVKDEIEEAIKPSVSEVSDAFVAVEPEQEPTISTAVLHSEPSSNEPEVQGTVGASSDEVRQVAELESPPDQVEQEDLASAPAETSEVEVDTPEQPNDTPASGIVEDTTPVTKAEDLPENTEIPVSVEEAQPFTASANEIPEPVPDADVPSAEPEEAIPAPVIEPDVQTVSEEPPVTHQVLTPVQEPAAEPVLDEVEEGKPEAGVVPLPNEVDDEVLKAPNEVSTEEAPATVTGDEITPSELPHVEAEEEVPVAIEETEIPVEPEAEVQQIPTIVLADGELITEQTEAAELATGDGVQDVPTIPILNIPDYPEETTKPAEVESPASPWTPSYSVNTQGPNATEEAEPEVVLEREETNVPVAEAATQSAVGETAVKEDVSKAPNWTPSYSVSQQGSPLIPAVELPSSVQDAAQSAQALQDPDLTPVDSKGTQEIPTPILNLPDDEPAEETAAIAPETTQSPSWTPSYSVSRQGSPTIAPKELDAKDGESISDEVNSAVVNLPIVSVAEAPAPASHEGDSAETSATQPWTPSYSVSVQGSPLSSTKALQPEGESEFNMVESGAIEQQPVADTTSAATTQAHEPEPGATSASPELERPVSPWTSSYSVTNQGPDQAPAADSAAENEAVKADTVPEVPILQLPVADTQAQQPTDPTPERPSSPWTPSYSVTTQSLPETADATEVPVIAPVPVPVNTAPLVEVVDQLAKEATTEALRSPSPGWTPSYSVSNQGSPAVENQELPDSQHERSFTEDTKATLVTEEAPEVRMNDFKANGHAFVVLPDEAGDQKATLPTIDPIHLSSASEEAPQPASPWTPSYSVSRQGSPLPTELEPSLSTKAESVKEAQATQGDLKATTAELAPVQAPTEAVEVPKSPSWTPSYSVSQQGARDEGVDKLEQLPALTGSNEVFPSTDKNRPSLQLETDTKVNGDADHYSRSRLESTASSRFFPGGWYTSTPKSPEGRPSLDNVHGEITPAHPTTAVEGKKKSRRCLIM